MSRRAGERTVDSVTHKKSGITIPIKLRTSSGEFIAVHSDESFANKDLPKLKEQILAFMDSIVDLTWIPVVKLELSPARKPKDIDEDDDTSIEVKFEYSRFMIAWTGAKWLQSDWEIGWYFSFKEPKDPVERAKAAAQWRLNNSKDCGDLGDFPGPEFVSPIQSQDGNADRYWHRNEYYLTYTEELWASLNKLIHGFNSLSAKLNELVKTQDGVTRLLRANGNLMLTEGK